MFEQYHKHILKHPFHYFKALCVKFNLQGHSEFFDNMKIKDRFVIIPDWLNFVKFKIEKSFNIFSYLDYELFKTIKTNQKFYSPLIFDAYFDQIPTSSYSSWLESINKFCYSINAPSGSYKTYYIKNLFLYSFKLLQERNLKKFEEVNQSLQIYFKKPIFRFCYFLLNGIYFEMKSENEPNNDT